MVQKFNLKISPSKFCKQLYLGHLVLILTLKSKCFNKGWTGKGKPVSFPSLSNELLPSEAGGGSGTGRGGGRWFQRRRQDDPQEQASLLCWMNIHTWRNVWATFEMLICLYVTIINKTWRFCPEKFSLCPCTWFRQPCFSEACHQKACQHIFSEVAILRNWDEYWRSWRYLQQDNIFTSWENILNCSNLKIVFLSLSTYNVSSSVIFEKCLKLWFK